MALKRITLRDFVIVRELDLELDAGFTVLTGETGAGKSILIDALQLALGARADAGVVREGAARCDVSVSFDSAPGCDAWLDEAGFDRLDDGLLLRRTVDVQAKSRGWINGSPATAGQLRALGDRLVDIHGQHAWQSLTRPDSVRDLLDAYAGADGNQAAADPTSPEPTGSGVRELLDAYAGADSRTLAPLWQRWRAAADALTQAHAAQDTLQREQERLSWQIGELEKLAPMEGEWQSLSADQSRLGHAQALQAAARDATALLEDDGAALSTLARALALLQDQQPYEPAFGELVDQLASAQTQIEDVAHSLHRYLGRSDLDPERLADVEERLSLWMGLARRYRRQPDELPTLLQSWRDELTALARAADLETLEADERRAAKAWRAAAAKLSALRHGAAPKLAAAVTQSMQGLGMQGGVFKVALEPLLKPAQHGLEDVQFLVAGHVGSAPRPIQKVASGGELSRIALAVAVTTSELGGAQTLIFDEVDAGVGGSVAHTVGQLMQQLGRSRQVLAVTHLPQVAARADAHLLVAKQRVGAGTASHVAAVAGDDRVAEVARMLGGAVSSASATTLAHAREMLDAAS
ncbi:MAG: DNA repair protein RecN [Burkholderiaceae bacterium]